MGRRFLAALRLQRAPSEGPASGAWREALGVAVAVAALASLGLEIRFGGTAALVLTGAAIGAAGWLAQWGAALAVSALLGVARPAGSAAARVLAYAQAPRVLLLLAPVPYLGFAAVPLAEIWAFASGVAAVEGAWPTRRGPALVIGGAGTLTRLLVTLLLAIALKT